MMRAIEQEETESEGLLRYLCYLLFKAIGIREVLGRVMIKED